MERNLAKLKRGTAKGVTRRALKKVLKPVAHAAAAAAFEIEITSRLTQRQRRGARFDFGRDVVSIDAPLDFGFADVGHYVVEVTPPNPYVNATFKIEVNDASATTQSSE